MRNPLVSFTGHHISLLEILRMHRIGDNVEYHNTRGKVVQITEIWYIVEFNEKRPFNNYGYSLEDKQRKLYNMDVDKYYSFIPYSDFDLKGV